MSAFPRLVAFDLDDTLAPSKGRVDPRMVDLLVRLAKRAEVAVISGARLEQYQDQLIAPLSAASAEPLKRIHLLPTCGTQYYRLEAGALTEVYRRALPPEVKTGVIEVLEEEARRLALWSDAPWGNIIEDRGSQVTFSALGQQAPLEAKEAWDPSGRKRRDLCAAVSARLPELAVRAGGSTSIDVTEHGIDKAYGMRMLAQQSGVPLCDMLFFGDSLDSGGNDYPVLVLGVECRAVDSWHHTGELLEQLLKQVP